MMQPKLICSEDAPAYLEVDKEWFKRNFEYGLTKIIINNGSIFFDRFELDKLPKNFSPNKKN